MAASSARSLPSEKSVPTRIFLGTRLSLMHPDPCDARARSGQGEGGGAILRELCGGGAIGAPGPGARVGIARLGPEQGACGLGRDLQPPQLVDTDIARQLEEVTP